MARQTHSSRKRLIIAAVIAAILVALWFDGGEEPLRPIVEEIPVPEAAR